MQYKFFRKGVEERVDPEVWQWEAYYSNGEVIKQFGEDGIFHQFAEIDQSRLYFFKMVSPQFPHVFTLLFEPGMKLIHYYDNYTFNAHTPAERHLKVYCFGYEKGREKKVFMITPNQTIICSDPENVRIV